VGRPAVLDFTALLGQISLRMRSACSARQDPSQMPQEPPSVRFATADPFPTPQVLLHAQRAPPVPTLAQALPHACLVLLRHLETLPDIV